MCLAEFNHYLEVEGDVFLLGSQFMASATALISKLFVPYHANWWDPSWAINSSPEVHFCCVWGVCCHPHEFCIAASRLLTSLQPQILVVPRVSSLNTENCRGGWGAELSFQKPPCFLPAPLQSSSAKEKDRESSKQCPDWDALREPFAQWWFIGQNQVCLWVLQFGVVISATGRKENHPLLDLDPSSLCVCRYCKREFMLFHSFLSLVLSVLLLSPCPSSVLCYFLQVTRG